MSHDSETPGSPPTTPPPAPPLSEPPRARAFALGKQVAFGFFLPTIALFVSWLGVALAGGSSGHGSSFGFFFSCLLSLAILAGGAWLAIKRRWRGVILGLILFAALVLILIVSCFAMLAHWGR